MYAIFVDFAAYYTRIAGRVRVNVKKACSIARIDWRFGLTFYLLHVHDFDYMAVKLFKAFAFNKYVEGNCMNARKIVNNLFVSNWYVVAVGNYRPCEIDQKRESVSISATRHWTQETAKMLIIAVSCARNTPNKASIGTILGKARHFSTQSSRNVRYGLKFTGPKDKVSRCSSQLCNWDESNWP